MNVPWLRCGGGPRIAILSTGDEVVMPGEPVGPEPDHRLQRPLAGGLRRRLRRRAGNLGIARRQPRFAADLAAGAAGADLLVTTGGASVGDHDLVALALGETGLELDFWKIAMRPGKPLMFGRIGGTPMLGLPGNPVSSLVCAVLFLRPALDVMLGRTTQRRPSGRRPCSAPIWAPTTGARTICRARLSPTLSIPTPRPRLSTARTAP